VGESTPEHLARVVGRDSELARLGDFTIRTSTARAFVLTGGPGIGKTTLWEAAIEQAREQDVRVLSARSSSAQAQLSFAALIDLFDGVDAVELAGLPAPQRTALEVALLRADPAGPTHAPAIGVGFLNALRALSSRSPLLVAIDDAQWLDAPSADVLAYAARRLADEPVRFLLARRIGPAHAFEQLLQRDEPERLEVGPLSSGATRRLLAERLNLSVSRQVLRRIAEVTLGNPLYVLEMGRALVERGIPDAGEDIPMPGDIEELLGTRVASLPAPLRRLLVAVALTADPRTAELATIEGTSALDDAVDAGLLVIARDRVRASHPLLAAVAKSSSRRSEQRELHFALAEAVADRELRAMHLALATDETDGALANTVADAAASASARGARHEAVQLAEHALRLTPPTAPLRSERMLALAAHLEAAGEMQRMTDLLRAELPTLPSGSARARAWVMLSEGTGPRTMDDMERYRAYALAESNDPNLRATVLAKNASNAAASIVERIADAEGWALDAMAEAKRAGPAVRRTALYSLAWTRAMTGRPVEDLCESSQAASDPSSYLAACPERVAAQRLVWRGEVSSARTLLERLCKLADERGERESYGLLRLHMCELHLRVGEWDATEALLDEWAESADRELMFRPKYERCRALLAAGRGDSAGAEIWGRRALERAQQTRCRWDGLEALRALGIAALLDHRPAHAAESLREVWEHTRREGVDEPGVFPAAPDLVEALVELGELDEARSVAAGLKELAQQQTHPWGLATADRCTALIVLAGATFDDEAADLLAGAASSYGELGLQFDAARSLLGLGRAQRRFKQWGGARRALEDAIAIFEAIGSHGWAAHAQSQLVRVGARRPSPSGELTATERRTAELAASGLSNKEIARELVVAIHTVEVHLSHAYAKLGIRSRAQLAQHL
jgi:DNA-binding CsgD family transcriptional regulator